MDFCSKEDNVLHVQQMQVHVQEVLLHMD